MDNSKLATSSAINRDKLFPVYMEKYDWESKIAFRNRADRIIHHLNLTVVTGEYIVEFIPSTRTNKVLGIKMWFEKEEDAVLMRLSF